MKCETCGSEFEVGDELKRLMVAGAVEQQCDRCAATYSVTAPVARLVATSERRTKISRLWRADKYDSNGKAVQWVSLAPQYPRQERARPRIPGRRDDRLEAFVMSEHTHDMSNKPATVLRTNLESFQARGMTFKVWKTPSFQDRLTGQSKIEVQTHEFSHIEDDGGLEVYVHMRNGGKVRLRFRN